MDIEKGATVRQIGGPRPWVARILDPLDEDGDVVLVTAMGQHSYVKPEEFRAYIASGKFSYEPPSPGAHLVKGKMDNACVRHDHWDLQTKCPQCSAEAGR